MSSVQLLIFILGSLLSADTTVRLSLSLHSSPRKQRRRPIAMHTASPPRKRCLCQKYSPTLSLVKVSEPVLEAAFSSLPPLSPKPVSCPKHAVNHAPVVNTAPRSVILPNKKSKTIVPT